MIWDDFRARQILGAGDLNAIKAELIRLGKVSAAPPLHVGDDPTGFRFELAEGETFPIKLTSGGTSGKYAWTRQTPVPGGTWADDDEAGTVADDPAIESNANASIPANTIILRAYRDIETAELRFERGAC